MAQDDHQAGVAEGDGKLHNSGPRGCWSINVRRVAWTFAGLVGIFDAGDLLERRPIVARSFAELLERHFVEEAPAVVQQDGDRLLVERFDDQVSIGIAVEVANLDAAGELRRPDRDRARLPRS